MPWRSATVAPNRRASATQSSIEVPARGTNGTTSTAPIRGCSPVCVSMSIASIAISTVASSAARTAAASPASVRTERLCEASLVRSRR
jgi:hypothetical protein